MTELLPQSPDVPAPDELHHLAVAHLTPDPFQPRLEFKQEAIQELAESIDLHGVLTPLLVRPMQGPNSRGRYWIVAGERRYRAAQLLGLKSLPCRIRPYENTQAAVVALAENVHRQDLSELEKAEALLRIKTLTERTWEQIAELVKLSPDYVKRLVGLLKLADPVKELLRDGRISARVAIALKPLPPKQQVEMAERALAEGLGAEEIREAALRLRTGKKRRINDPPELEEVLARTGPIDEPRLGGTERTLRECVRAVEGIGGWLSRRRWSRSSVTTRQRDAIDSLYEQVSLLQQQLAQLRHSLREPDENAAEKLW